jgi:hypothetical protein
VRLVFDENMPRVLAEALRPIARALAEPGSIEVLHALDLASTGTPDVSLIEAVAAFPGKAALITTDKSMRTRAHERAAFQATGCIGIVLVGGWNQAPLIERAQLSLIWWETWATAVAAVAPGSLLKCPYSRRPKALAPF